MRVLWITPKWPYPATDGGRVATINLLHGLAQRNVEIDLLAIVGRREAVNATELRQELPLRDIRIVRREDTAVTTAGYMQQTATGLLGNAALPLTLQKYATDEVRGRVGSLMRSGHWDYVVYDGMHAAAHAEAHGLYRAELGHQGSRIVYRAHNCEFEIWERKAAEQKNPLLKFLFRSQAKKVRKFERSLVEKSDGVASVSERDLNTFEGMTPSAQGRCVPIGYNFVEEAEWPRGDNIPVMYLGRLDWPPNRDGLQWFLEKVWPRAVEKNPRLSLEIAGSGNGAWLSKYAGLRNLRLLGRVDSVDDLYRRSMLSIVPIFYGSGTRVKAIESCRYSRACLSTAVGVEGIPLEEEKSFIRAETAEDWIQKLAGVEPKALQTMGRVAFATARSHFDKSVATSHFIDLLETTSAGPERAVVTRPMPSSLSRPRPRAGLLWRPGFAGGAG